MSPRSLVGSYPTVSPLPAVSRRRSAFCATFRRLSPPGISPASCPAVSGLSSERRLRSAARGHPACTAKGSSISGTSRPRRGSTGTRGRRSRRRSVQDELAAHEALEAGAADERDELLVERARERRPRAHRRLRKTPITLPRTCDVVGVDRLERVVLRLQPDAAVLAVERLHGRLVGGLVVADERDNDVAVLGASCWRCTTSMSPSRIPASTIESPLHAEQEVGAAPERLRDGDLRPRRSPRRAAARRRRSGRGAAAAGRPRAPAAGSAARGDRRARAHAASSGRGAAARPARGSQGGRARSRARRGRRPRRSRGRWAGSRGGPRSSTRNCQISCCRAVSIGDSLGGTRDERVFVREGRRPSGRRQTRGQRGASWGQTMRLPRDGACAGEDLNLHDRNGHKALNLARLPIPPPARGRPL